MAATVGAGDGLSASRAAVVATATGAANELRPLVNEWGKVGLGRRVFRATTVRSICDGTFTRPPVLVGVLVQVMMLLVLILTSI